MDDIMRTVTIEQAISLLPQGEYIHTILNPGNNMFFGSNWSRFELIEEMKKCSGTIQLSGRMARQTGHGVGFRRGEGWVFVETDAEKLNKFDPL